MGGFNLIKFRFRCDSCAQEHDFFAQCRTPKYNSPSDIRFDGREYFYLIGDVMEWFDEPERERDWPGDYAFVSNLDGPSVYVIERCWGQCPGCRKAYNFYFFLKDRQIMRLIGHEDANLNDNSVRP